MTDADKKLLRDALRDYYKSVADAKVGDAYDESLLERATHVLADALRDSQEMKVQRLRVCLTKAVHPRSLQQMMDRIGMKPSDLDRQE